MNIAVNLLSRLSRLDRTVWLPLVLSSFFLEEEGIGEVFFIITFSFFPPILKVIHVIHDVYLDLRI